jgi:hypothetical protein
MPNSGLGHQVVRDLPPNRTPRMSPQQISDMCAAFGRCPSELDDIALRSVAYNAEQRDDHRHNESFPRATRAQ